MTPVFQEIVDSERGDCTRAVYATLLDLELCQVPHFILFKKHWLMMLIGFLELLGYEFVGTEYCDRKKERKEKLRLYKKYSINGYYAASVKSATFKDVFHLVVMDQKGNVVHDPNPNKAFLGKNILKSKELLYFHLIKKIKRKR